MFAGATLVLPPDHAVDDARVGLDDLHDLGGDLLGGVVGHRRLGEAALRVERHRGAGGVEEPPLVDAGEREAAALHGLRALDESVATCHASIRRRPPVIVERFIPTNGWRRLTWKETV